MMSSGRIVPPDMAVEPKLFMSAVSAGIYERDVKIFLILKQPSSWMTSIVFMEFEFWAVAFLAPIMFASLDI